MQTVMFLYILFFLFVLFYLHSKWKHSYWKRQGIKYLEPEFFFGNTRQFVQGKTHLSKTFQNFYHHFKSKGEQFGGVYSFLTPILIPVDLELIKNIVQKDFHHFVNHGLYINEEADPLSGHLFNLENERWKNVRAKLTPTFSTGKMRMMFEAVAECTSDLEKLLFKHSELGDPVDIKDVLARLTTDIISSVAFGLDVKSIENPDSDFRKYGKKIFEPSFQQILKGMMMDSLPKWLLVKLRFRSFSKDLETFFSNLVKNIVEYREQNNVHRKDFMHLLIQLKNMDEITDDGQLRNNSGVGSHLSIQEMTAHSFVFFVAGFETSSSTMSFALLEMAQNNAIQDKVRSEINEVLERHGGKMTYDAVMEMDYLEKVLLETLRKHSAASLIRRVCNKEYKLPNSNIVIKPGTKVIIPIHGLHKDPEYYPNPEVFDPERFSLENRNKIPQCAFLPFGEGPRVCMGVRFGKMQMKAGLCSIVKNFKVTINEKTQLPITYSRDHMPSVKGGLWLNLQKIRRQKTEVDQF